MGYKSKSKFYNYWTPCIRIF